MIGYPLTLVDRHRLELFTLLGRPRRLDLMSKFWTDGQGIPWSGAQVGAIGVALTALGAGWVFDPQARQDRLEAYLHQLRAVEQAREARRRLLQERVVRDLRLGRHAERVLWAIHIALLRRGSSMLCLPDIWL